MIIRGTPQNKDEFVCVGNELSNYLHTHGYFPAYIDNEGIYYHKTKEILQCIQDR